MAILPAAKRARRLKLLLAAHLLLSPIALLERPLMNGFAYADRIDAIFGIGAAQKLLLAAWVGAGVSTWRRRWLAVAAGALWFALLGYQRGGRMRDDLSVTTYLFDYDIEIEAYGLLGFLPGQELLLIFAVVQNALTLALGALVFAYYGRLRNRLQLNPAPPPARLRSWQFELRHWFAFVAIAALYLSLIARIQSDPHWKFFPVPSRAVRALTGLNLLCLALWAFAAVLRPGRAAARSLAAIVGGVALPLATFALAGLFSEVHWLLLVMTALDYGLTTLIFAVSLVAVRSCGYRLVAADAGGASRSDSAPAEAPARPSARPADGPGGAL